MIYILFHLFLKKIKLKTITTKVCKQVNKEFFNFYKSTVLNSLR